MGVSCEMVALLVMGLANHGWIVFALMLLALRGIGMPALQSLIIADAGCSGENSQPNNGVCAAIFQFSVF
ncbi:MAG: hypothetical protein MO846_08595 [Candidatus Devosia symbiotica]|nr:hypothetical protein [Candidatus Devosia symbiotica]